MASRRAPGLYPDLDEGVYRADPALAQSDLKRFMENRRAFMLDRENAGPRDDSDSAAKRQGRLFHLATLQPEIFYTDYGPLPRGWSLDERHERIRNWRISNPGREPVREHEWTQAVAMSNGIRKHHHICEMIETGRKELSLFWTDPVTGLDCKGRIDLYNEATRTVLDLKGVDVGATLDEFLISCFKWRYFVQAAYYLDGLRALGKPVDHFIFLAYERSVYKPDCMPVMLGPFSEELGRQSYRYDLERYKALGGLVPQLPDDVQVAELPGWAMEREFRRINEQESS